ncbi:hypothetical protein ASPFODRAFT_304104 [Aspergillus luchuensis CBS 106.47]|uniref:Uncharacterized protein n=1 Tax=Aspergillus luchuensis (strain CBS 106.47) TaxID=1137211 RepID=A0A1M3TBI4_ASPLC|nr:hypothetical protein ASPFODRAFT_304104 [Aspergillus luchuensis CBS 106.47]
MSERHYGYHEIMKLMTLFLSILLFSPFDFSLPSFFFIALVFPHSIVVFFIGCGYLGGSLGCIEPRLTDSRHLDGFRSFPNATLLYHFVSGSIHGFTVVLLAWLIQSCPERSRGTSPSSLGSLRVLFCLLLFLFLIFSFF